MKSRCTLLLSLIAVALCSPVGKAAEPKAAFKLPSIFADGMVLQRDKPVPVWGWAEAGAEITVEFAGQTKTAKADPAAGVFSQGAGGPGQPAPKAPVLAKWMVRLEAMPSSAEPRTMTIMSSISNLKFQISNVLVGDVWLCCGQSNMAMTVDGKTGWLYVGGVANAKEEVKNSANPLIRQFYVDWKTDTTPARECMGKWSIAGPEPMPKEQLPATANFTATGYFFARELQKRLKIPIAIINSSFGGSAVEQWTSREMLLKEGCPDYITEMNTNYDRYVNRDQYKARYERDLRAWEKKYGVNDPSGVPGNGNTWAEASTDTSDWKKVSFPCSMAKAGYAGGGVVWFRKEVEIPAEMGTSWRLDIPRCNGNFAVYANGVMSPNGGGRASFPRTALKAGRNTIAIRIHAYPGTGGIAGGDFVVQPFDPKFKRIPLSGEWLCKAEAEFKPLLGNADKPPVPPSDTPLHWLPIPAHFNTMIHPLIPYAIKGVTWYQGESNVGRADRYSRHLQVLVKDWRQRWGQSEFPFYICQLPGYGARSNAPMESGWAEIREAQFVAAREMPSAAVANLIDTCEDGDLHPLNKQDVGRRLALVALANTYGLKDLSWSGPVYRSSKIKDGKVFVEFDHADGGLVAKKLPATYKVNLRKPELGEKPLELPSPNSQIQGFAICGKDRQWIWAEAKIDGPSVIVWSDKVPQPVAIRYAWADHPVCNLYNKAGLPAFPFRTDDFPRVEPKPK